MVITFVLMFSGLVLSEAMLSWLGIGIDGSWGQMIDQARDELSRDPIICWNLAAASAALFALILAVNLVGDALRDVLDPRTAPRAAVALGQTLRLLPQKLPYQGDRHAALADGGGHALDRAQRTSPHAKMPGTLVSSRYGSRLCDQRPAFTTSSPVRT